MNSEAEAILEEIRGRLREMASEERRQSTMGFFREPVDPYGIPVPKVRGVVSEVAGGVKKLAVVERNALCTELMKSGRLEESILAAYLYKRFGRTCGRAEFTMFAGWAQRYLKDWASTDTLCCNPVAACIANDPSLAGELLEWTESKNRWKRRAAAVSLVREGRGGRLVPVIFQVAERLMEDPDEMVQKGVGWLLKETYPKHPKETVAFLLPWRTRASRLLLRYAAEKMTAEDRAKVLAK